MKAIKVSTLYLTDGQLLRLGGLKTAVIVKLFGASRFGGLASPFAGRLSVADFCFSSPNDIWLRHSQYPPNGD